MLLSLKAILLVGRVPCPAASLSATFLQLIQHAV